MSVNLSGHKNANKFEEYADFRICTAVRNIGRDTLYQVLLYACPKLSIETYKGYLKNNTTVSFSTFDSTQKKKLQNDPSGLSFDISLLYKVICKGCGKIAQKDDDVRWNTKGEVEFYLRLIKNKRNDIAHRANPIPHQELSKEMTELESMFLNTIDAAEGRFNISQTTAQEIRSMIISSLKELSKTPFTEDFIDEYIMNEGVLEIKDVYKRLSNINPMNFFAGLECPVDVSEIFVNIEARKLIGCTEGTFANLNCIFKLFDSKGGNIDMIIIEGLAGSGKSTLLKYFLAQWCLESSSVTNLHNFNILVYMQCNNSFICSVYDLFQSLMPKTSRKIDKDSLVSFILSRNPLLLIDGVDELTQNNKVMFQELINSIIGKKAKIICTTRPEKLKWIHAIKKGTSSGIIKLTGIPTHNRDIFAEKYRLYLVESLQLESTFDSKTLTLHLENIAHNLGEEVRLPLMLTMIIYLLLIEPSKVDCFTSKMKVYEELIFVLKGKLVERALNYCPTKDFLEIEKTCEEMCEVFYEESLKCLSTNNAVLPQESIQKISDKSKELGMTGPQALSSFLATKTDLTPRGIQYNYSFPHKGLLDFMAAKAMAKRFHDQQEANEQETDSHSEPTLVLQSPVGKLKSPCLNSKPPRAVEGNAKVTGNWKNKISSLFKLMKELLPVKGKTRTRGPHQLIGEYFDSEIGPPPTHDPPSSGPSKFIKPLPKKKSSTRRSKDNGMTPSKDIARSSEIPKPPTPPPPASCSIDLSQFIKPLSEKGVQAGDGNATPSKYITTYSDIPKPPPLPPASSLSYKMQFIKPSKKSSIQDAQVNDETTSKDKIRRSDIPQPPPPPPVSTSSDPPQFIERISTKSSFRGARVDDPSGITRRSDIPKPLPLPGITRRSDIPKPLPLPGITRPSDIPKPLPLPEKNVPPPEFIGPSPDSSIGPGVSGILNEIKSKTIAADADNVEEDDDDRNHYHHFEMAYETIAAHADDVHVVEEDYDVQLVDSDEEYEGEEENELLSVNDNGHNYIDIVADKVRNYKDETAEPKKMTELQENNDNSPISKSEVESRRPSQYNIELKESGDLDIHSMQNTLQFLSHMLANLKCLSEESISEIINLYDRSEVLEFEQWLELLQTVDYHELVCRHIHKIFSQITVKDAELESLQNLLKYGQFHQITIEINYLPKTFELLQNVIDSISEREINLRLLLNYAFKGPITYVEDVQLQNVFKSGVLEEFSGCLIEKSYHDLTKAIPISSLRLGIASEEQAEVLTKLSRLRRLIRLDLHIVGGTIMGDILPSLAEIKENHLYLSHVSGAEVDVNWTMCVISQLYKTSTLHRLSLPRCTMDKDALEGLLRCLKKERIDIREVTIQSMRFGSEEEEDIEDLGRAFWGETWKFEVFEGDIF